MNARDVRRALAAGGAALVLVLLAACGGGGGGGGGGTGSSGSTSRNGPVALPGDGTVAANAATLAVDTGFDGTTINSPFISVTVCVPGTSTCQTIDHIMVDTGSYGLRIAASALNGAMTLPPVAAPSGDPLAECAGFVSGYAWGPVRSADVQITGELALGVPVQVVNDPTFAVPAACSNTGPSMGVGAGAKGILGVGFNAQDCGSTCVNSSVNVYFTCPATGCVSTTAPLASQVTNPVALFPTDNNGVTIVLPDVPLGGVPTATGLLIFGVGTASNNQVGSARVYTANAAGNFTTVYKGRTLSAFLDSGSNGIFFNDASFPTCTGGFYCPGSATSLTATVTGTNGASSDVSFVVEDVRTISNDDGAAHLAGSLGSSRSMDWGLPFFFGRTVFVAMRGASTPFGTGPYWAF